MRTVSRRATRQIADLKKQLTCCKVYTLENYFHGKEVEPEYAWKALETGLRAKLTENDSGTYTVHVHSNCWYELRRPQGS